MKVITTPRGFRVIQHETDESHDLSRLVQEASIVGDYEDADSKPGSSYLWVGTNHLLNREEVRALVDVMKEWLRTGRLPEEIL